MDGCARSDGDVFQNAGRDAAGQAQPQTRPEIQHAALLLLGSAACRIEEFYMLPVGRELVRYSSIAVNTIVQNIKGEVSSCDVPFSGELRQFNEDYLRLTGQVAKTCENHDLTDSMVIGTSAIVDTMIDGAVGMNSGIFNNPFIIWGRYRRTFFKTTLNISFQFHHTQMDGAHAGRFLEYLQETIRELRWA